MPLSISNEIRNYPNLACKLGKALSGSRGLHRAKLPPLQARPPFSLWPHSAAPAPAAAPPRAPAGGSRPGFCNQFGVAGDEVEMGFQTDCTAAGKAGDLGHASGARESMQRRRSLAGSECAERCTAAGPQIVALDALGQPPNVVLAGRHTPGSRINARASDEVLQVDTTAWRVCAGT